MAKLIKDTGKAQEKIRHKMVAQALGAKETGIRIDSRRGPVSLYTLRQFLADRLFSTGGRPKLDGASKKRNKIPFIDDDWHKLEALAKYYREKEGISVSPGQIASALIHFHVSNIDMNQIGIYTDRSKLEETKIESG